MGSEGAAMCELIRKVLRLEDDRASAYNSLAAAHKAYLQSGAAAKQVGEEAAAYDFETYKKAVDASTKVFSRASKEAMDVKASLTERSDGKALSDLVSKLQDLEERKLRFTVDHQLALQEVQEHPDDDLQSRNEKGLKRTLVGLTQEIVDTISEVRYLLVDYEEEDDVKR